MYINDIIDYFLGIFGIWSFLSSCFKEMINIIKKLSYQPLIHKRTKDIYVNVHHWVVKEINNFFIN